MKQLDIPKYIYLHLTCSSIGLNLVCYVFNYDVEKVIYIMKLQAHVFKGIQRYV